MNDKTVKRIRIHKNSREQKALLNAFNCGAWVVGKELAAMETNLKTCFNKKYALLTSSGFASLFLSLKSLNIKNQPVYLPEISTCFAMVNAVIASGNIPKFISMDALTGNININEIKDSKSIKYLVAPNHNGVLTNIEKIKKNNIVVIEDCAQSFLSSTKKKSSADFQVFSFYPTKLINGIDGGAILTDDLAHYEKIKKMIYYDDQLKFEAEERFNFRLNNINASVFNANFSRLHKIEKKLESISGKYKKALGNVIHVLDDALTKNVFNKFIIVFKTEQEKRKVVKLSKTFGIDISPVFIKISNTNISSDSTLLLKYAYQIPYFEDLKKTEIKRVCHFLAAIKHA